jgi:hypothetical protein
MPSTAPVMVRSAHGARLEPRTIVTPQVTGIADALHGSRHDEERPRARLEPRTPVTPQVTGIADALHGSRHGEERPWGASRTTHHRDAAG